MVERHMSFAHDSPLSAFVGKMTQQEELRDPSKGRQKPRKGMWTHAFLDGSNMARPRPLRRDGGLPKPTSGRNFGTMVCSAEDRAEFLKAYAQTIDAGHVVCVSEKAVIPGHNTVQRAFVDFDLKEIGEEPPEESLKLGLTKVWLSAVRECYPEAQANHPTWLQAFVLMRNNTRKELESGETQWNCGVHVVLPNLITTADKLLVIRQLTLQKLALFPPLTGSWEDIVDQKVDTLRMLGSHKATACKACRTSRQRRDPECKQCDGKGMIIDMEGVYHLEHILDAEGNIDMTTFGKLSGQTRLQVQCTCISTLATEDREGFVHPATVPKEMPGAHKHHGAGAGSGAGSSSGSGPGDDDEAALQREVVSEPDVVECLVGYARRVHAVYATIEGGVVERLFTNFGTLSYQFRPHQPFPLPCLNLQDKEQRPRAHNSHGIYFSFTKAGDVFQRCTCPCAKGRSHGRVRGLCKATKNYGQFRDRKMSTADRLLLFRYSKARTDALMRAEASQQSTLTLETSRRDLWCSALATMQHDLSMRLFKKPVEVDVSMTSSHAVARMALDLQKSIPAPQSLSAFTMTRRLCEAQLQSTTDDLTRVMKQCMGIQRGADDGEGGEEEEGEDEEEEDFAMDAQERVRRLHAEQQEVLQAWSDHVRKCRDLSESGKAGYEKEGEGDVDDVMEDDDTVPVYIRQYGDGGVEVVHY